MSDYLGHCIFLGIFVVLWGVDYVVRGCCGWTKYQSECNTVVDWIFWIGSALLVGLVAREALEQTGVL